MFDKILTSPWVVIPVFGLAAGALALLYTRGRTSEALAGAVILGVALILVLFGGKRRDSNPDAR